MSETTRAFKVSDLSEDWMEIVFATSPGKAKRMCDAAAFVDYIELKAKRASAFDDLADCGKVSTTDLLNRGYWIECRQCCARVSEISELVILEGGYEACVNCFEPVGVPAPEDQP